MSTQILNNDAPGMYSIYNSELYKINTHVTSNQSNNHPISMAQQKTVIFLK